MKPSIVMMTLALSLLSACAARPDAYRRTALVLADEIHLGITQWDAKIQAEQVYAIAVQKNVYEGEIANIASQENFQGKARRDEFIDAEMLGKRAPSLTATRNFLQAAHDARRDAEDARMQRMQEARAATAISFEKVLFERARLEEVERSVRATATEGDAAVRKRLLGEWQKKVRDEYRAIEQQQQQ